MLTQKKPLLSASSYWVSLRPAQPSYLVFAKDEIVLGAATVVLPPLL